MKKIFSLILFLVISKFIFAQQIDTARFRIEFAPTIQNFDKINTNAVIVDTVVEKVKFNYYIAPQRIDLSFTPSAVQPAKMPADVMKRLYRNFIRVGFGFPVTPLAQLNIHNFDNQKFSYGINVNHFSLWAPQMGKTMQNYAYAPVSDTKTSFFIHRFFKKSTFYNNFGYNHQVAHRFAFSKLDGYDDYYYSKVYRDTLRNNFHHAFAVSGIRSNQTADIKTLKYDIRIMYDYIYTHPKDQENYIGMKSFFAYDDRFMKVSGSQNFRMDINFDYFYNKWSNDVHLNNLTKSSYKIELKPTMTFEVKEYALSVGLGFPIINSTLYSKAKMPIYPIAEVQLGIIPGIMSIYGGINGNAKFNSLKDLLYENPYLKPNIDSLRFTRTQINLYGGIKGNLVKKLNYHFSVRYSYSKDMPFYMIDTTSLLKNQFDVVYSDVNILNACGNITWQVIDHLYLNFNLNYWGYYNLTTLPKAFYKPTWEGGFGGKYYHGNQYIFDLNFKMAFDRWAFIPLANNNYVIAKMRPVLNFDASFEYLITKQFSAFAQINNIASQYYSKYYDFKNFGLNFIVGVTYSFGDEPLRKPKGKR
ncbi:MAG TPA: hypothetical protein PKG88_02110 [Bacteroidales bacterium]|nr:hypothetical protein [Bacteroidales bacterium]HPS71412.1 hypothetical protein [Bacteroidales bacterium]